jgi:hypothetical protein
MGITKIGRIEARKKGKKGARIKLSRKKGKFLKKAENKRFPAIFSAFF